MWWNYRSAVVEKKKYLHLFCGSRYTFQPIFSLLYLRDLVSQDADRIVSVKCFQYSSPTSCSVRNGLNCKWWRRYCIATARFRDKEELSWLCFIWCLSYRHELEIYDSMHEHLSFVKQCLRNLFCLYEKFTKKVREPRLLHQTFEKLCISKWAKKTKIITQHAMNK